MATSMDEKMSVLREALPHDKTPEQKAKRLALFKQLDKDGSGALTFNEVYNGFVNVLHLNKYTTRLRDISRRAFEKAKSMGTKDRGAGDEDLVEFLEFRLMLCYLYDYFELSALFELADTSGDRVLDRDEFVQLAPEMRKWGLPLDNPQEAFHTIDENGSGQVTFDEFVSWAVAAKMEREGDPDAEQGGAAQPPAATPSVPDEAASTPFIFRASSPLKGGIAECIQSPVGAAHPNWKNDSSVVPATPAPAAAAPRSAPAAVASSGPADVWKCKVCSKVKDLQGGHLDGKMEVRSDCWPCGKKQTFERGGGSGGATAQETPATPPAATPSEAKASGAGPLRAPEVREESAEVYLPDTAPKAAPPVLAKGVLGAAPASNATPAAAAPRSAPAAVASSGPADVWKCKVCSKVKDLQGGHLDGKMEVRSDCWPCGKKQTFERCGGDSALIVHNATDSLKSPPTSDVLENNDAGTIRAAEDLHVGSSASKAADNLKCDNETVPTMTTNTTNSLTTAVASDISRVVAAEAQKELGRRLFEWREETARHAIEEEQRMEAFLLRKAESDRILLERVSVQTQMLLGQARTASVMEREKLDTVLEDRVKETILKTFDRSAASAEDRALQHMRVDLRDELERTREVWLSDRSERDDDLLRRVHAQMFNDFATFKLEIVQDVRVMLGAQALAALQDKDDTLLLQEQAREVSPTRAPSDAQRHLRSAFRKLS